MRLAGAFPASRMRIMMYVPKIFDGWSSLRGLAAGLLLLSSTGFAADRPVSIASHAPIAVHILEKGVYEAETIASTSKKEATGIQNVVRNPRLVRSTAVVPGRIGVRFGMRYLVGGPTETNVELKLIIRFPDSGLLDPKTGARYFQTEHSAVMQTGAPGYWEYHLENDWEIVPGIWQFEFWSNAGRLAVERFCVIEGASRPETEIVRKCSQILMGGVSSNEGFVDRQARR